MKTKTDSSGHKSTGYIYLHRSVMETSFFQDKFCKPMAWIDLLMLANHSEATILVRGKPIKIIRGQVGYSQESLAKRWKWSRNKIRRFLKLLENEHMIEQVNEQVNKYLKSVITIVNYEYYQGEHLKGQVKTQLRDNSETTHGTVTSNVSNSSNESNNNNNAISSPKKTKKRKSIPVRDNPPSIEEILAFCVEEREKGKISKDYIDPHAFLDSYSTYKDDDLKWTYANGKDIMNWKLLLKNIHDKNKRENKIVNNNYVQDGSRPYTRADHIRMSYMTKEERELLPDIVGKRKGTKYLDNDNIGRDMYGSPTECKIY